MTISLLPIEIISAIDDAARLCGIDLCNDHGSDLPPESSEIIRNWFINELFCRPACSLRPALAALPKHYKSHLVFILYSARESALKLEPRTPVVLHFGLAGVLTDVLNGRLNCQMLL